MCTLQGTQGKGQAGEQTKSTGTSTLLPAHSRLTTACQASMRSSPAIGGIRGCDLQESTLLGRLPKGGGGVAGCRRTGAACVQCQCIRRHRLGTA